MVRVSFVLGIDFEPLTSFENSGSPVAFSVIIKPVSENAKKPIVSPGKAKENLNRDALDERQKAADKRRKVLNLKYCTCIQIYLLTCFVKFSSFTVAFILYMYECNLSTKIYSFSEKIKLNTFM